MSQNPRADECRIVDFRPPRPGEYFLAREDDRLAHIPACGPGWVHLAWKFSAAVVLEQDHYIVEKINQETDMADRELLEDLLLLFKDDRTTETHLDGTTWHRGLECEWCKELAENAIEAQLAAPKAAGECNVRVNVDTLEAEQTLEDFKTKLDELYDLPSIETPRPSININRLECIATFNIINKES